MQKAARISYNFSSVSLQFKSSIALLESHVYIIIIQMEAKIILARLLNSFKIDLEEGYQLKVEEVGTLKPADDVPCTVVPLK